MSATKNEEVALLLTRTFEVADDLAWPWAK